MTADPFDILPPERRETVQAAVRGAFDAATPSPLLPVSGGFSGALTYKFEVAGRPYLLRLETARDFFRDTRRGFACMATAAEAGVAPPLRFVDADAGAAIMDFLPQRPLSEYPDGAPGLVRALGGLVRALQDTPPFPPLADYRLILNGMTRQLAGSGLFAKGLLDPHLECLATIEAAYPWDAAGLVSSHNDPNPRNLLFDGERLWLVDWELAFRNDPLVDLAILANEFSQSPDLEAALLTAWGGRAPDAMTTGRLTLMRQLTRLFYAGIILTRFAALPRERPDEDLSAPSPGEFRAAVAEGRLLPAAPDTAYLYGKMYLAGFLAEREAPAFRVALATVRRG
jgi:aminoglycoside phosphotransferase (APT) family kinase protein